MSSLHCTAVHCTVNGAKLLHVFFALQPKKARNRSVPNTHILQNDLAIFFKAKEKLERGVNGFVEFSDINQCF